MNFLDDYIYYEQAGGIFIAECPLCHLTLQYRKHERARRELAIHIENCERPVPFNGEPVSPPEEIKPEYYQYG